jgi:hypothetical protein
MPLNQTDHGDVSWWTTSQGWPETREHAYAKWVLAGRGIIPYGTYVINGDVLRVETRELLDKLNQEFDIVRRAIIESNTEQLNRLSDRRSSFNQTYDANARRRGQY